MANTNLLNTLSNVVGQGLQKVGQIRRQAETNSILKDDQTVLSAFESGDYAQRAAGASMAGIDILPAMPIQSPHDQLAEDVLNDNPDFVNNYIKSLQAENQRIYNSFLRQTGDPSKAIRLSSAYKKGEDKVSSKISKGTEFAKETKENFYSDYYNTSEGRQELVDQKNSAVGYEKYAKVPDGKGGYTDIIRGKDKTSGKVLADPNKQKAKEAGFLKVYNSAVKQKKPAVSAVSLLKEGKDASGSLATSPLFIKLAREKGIPILTQEELYRQVSGAGDKIDEEFLATMPVEAVDIDSLNEVQVAILSSQYDDVLLEALASRLGKKLPQDKRIPFELPYRANLNPSELLLKRQLEDVITRKLDQIDSTKRSKKEKEAAKNNFFARLMQDQNARSLFDIR